MFSESPRDRTITVMMLALGIAIGIALLVLSYVGREHGWPLDIPDLLRDFGIVIASVFTVHFLYEKAVAKEHLDNLWAMLTAQLKTMDTLSASAYRWGIVKFYDSRPKLIEDVETRQRLESMGRGTTFRMIARTGVHMTTGAALRKALEQGAVIELCFLNPLVPQSVTSIIPGLTQDELWNGFDRVYKHFIEDLRRGTLRGATFRLRLHDVPLLDSYWRIAPTEGTRGADRDDEMAVWDLSFGFNLDRKRAIRYQKATTENLAGDLAERYDEMWARAEAIFVFENGNIQVDQLSSFTKSRRTSTT